MIRSTSLFVSTLSHSSSRYIINTSKYYCRRSFTSSSSSSSSSSSWKFGLKSSLAVSIAVCGVGAIVYYTPTNNTSSQQSMISSQRNTSEDSLSSKVFNTLCYPFTLLKNKLGDAADDLVKDFADPISDCLLPDASPDAFGNVPRTLVLDVEGTLMANTYERGKGWRAIKRPGVDLFLTRMFQAGYEIVTFSSGHQGNVEPAIMRLDSHRVVTHRLYREATSYRKGVHIKDISKLNRDLRRIIIIDDEADSFAPHPHNGIRIAKFDADSINDSELVQLIPFLESLVKEDVSDVREVLRAYDGASSEDIAHRFIQNRIERNTKSQVLNDSNKSTGTINDGALSSDKKKSRSWASWLGLGSSTRSLSSPSSSSSSSST